MRLRLPSGLASLLLAAAVGASAASPAPLPDFAAVAAQAPIVVSIRTVSTRWPTRVEDAEDEEGEDVEEREAPPPRERARPQRGTASGFVVGADGWILTSAHVVSGVTATTVRLDDGRELVARVIGSDAVSDVALLRVDAVGLPAARIGSSAALVTGEWVAAIGAPFGLESSLTAGVISARRELPGNFGTLMLQSDVAMNPGNSGSPLFNLAGEVVGLNSVVYTLSGGYMGVSFSLPIEAAMAVATQLRRGERIVRGRLGVRVQEATPGLARAFGRSSGGGALVIADGEGSAAALRGGDIVLGLAGGEPLGYSALQQLIAAATPGASLRLSVWRDGRLQAVDAIIQRAAAPEEESASPDTGGDLLGLVVVDAGASVRERLAGRAGPLVKEAHGPALRSGLGPGDRILAVNARPTPDRKTYEAAVATLQAGGDVAVLVLRDGRTAYVHMHLED